MIPKGLGAAVLASLPAQQGVEGGDVIQSVVFAIILCTTFLTTFLSFLVEKTFVAQVYGWIFKILGLGKTENKEEAVEKEVTPEITSRETDQD
jgi:potassium/hydrogen antiporter